MCGIVGMQSRSRINKDVVEKLLIQTSIRGMHATGVSKVVDEKLSTLVLPLPADKFIQSDEWKSFSSDLGNMLIAHCRYSTSDINYNMPLVLNDSSLVHNGVITQEEREDWPVGNYETRNDSELLLHDLVLKTENLKRYPEASYAYLWLHKVEGRYQLYAHRNGLRPLYRYEDDNITVYASTSDILSRSGFAPAEKLECEGEDSQVKIGNSYKSSIGTLRDKQTLPDLVEDRVEYFLRYYEASMRVYDTDPAMFMLCYLCDRMEMNIEQRYLLSLFYSFTYHVPTAWVMWNEFPDLKNLDMDRFSRWYKTNKVRLVYESDMRWKKLYTEEIVGHYKNLIGSGTQEEFFNSMTGSTPTESFYNLWDELPKKLIDYGRYTIWTYLQCLKEVCGLNTEPDTLFLSESKATSQRSALAFMLGMDEKAKVKKYKYTQDETERMNFLSYAIFDLMRERCPDLNLDYYNYETCLCAWKKTFTSRSGKGRYIGYYHDRVAKNIDDMKSKGWSGINWNLLEECRNEMIDRELIVRRKPDNSLMLNYLETGNPYMLENIPTGVTLNNAVKL